MTLKKFATDAGVSIVKCHQSWGGKFAYKTKDNPNAVVNGFRTESAAYRHWLRDTFGEHVAKAIVKLILRNDKLEEAVRK